MGPGPLQEVEAVYAALKDRKHLQLRKRVLQRMLRTDRLSFRSFTALLRSKSRSGLAPGLGLGLKSAPGLGLSGLGLHLVRVRVGVGVANGVGVRAWVRVRFWIASEFSASVFSHSSSTRV